MIICKQKEVGGAVNSHDDSTFLYSNPLSALGLWFALEDATPTNGCLSFVPGSHKVNRIHSRLERVEGGGTEIRKIPLKEGEEEVKLPDWDGEGIDWVAAPCEAGDLVLIHGSVIHRSEANLSQKSRFIYTVSLFDIGSTQALRRGVQGWARERACVEPMFDLLLYSSLTVLSPVPHD